MIKCELCGKKFKTVQGLRGHQQWKHNVLNKQVSPAAELHAGFKEIFKKFLNQDELWDNMGHSKEDFNTLGQQVALLSRELDNYYKQMGELSREVAGHLNGLKELRYLFTKSEGEIYMISKKLADYRSEYGKAYSRLIAITSNNGEGVKCLGNQIQQLEKQQKALQKDDVDLTFHFSVKVKLLEQAIYDLRKELAHVKNLAIRIPTGKVRSVELSNGSFRNFEVYKSKRGLNKPYKIATDIISGAEYIDLAESKA